MKKSSMLAAVLGLVMAVTANAAAPQILGVVEQALLGPSGEFRCTIATDSQSNPHIVSTEGTAIHFYDKVGGSWRAESASSSGLFGSGQYGNPYMEIVSGDIGWVGGVLFGGRFGIGVINRRNMASSPTPVATSARTGIRVSPGAWDAGNISIDPAKPNNVVVSSMAGYYSEVGYTPAAGWYAVGSGQMYAGEGGEKNTFRVSKAGSPAVWHGAIGGYYGYSSAYRNSLMGGPTTWASAGTYVAQNDDGAYVYVVGDNKDRARGYIVAAYAGIVMNIWDGSKMLFPVNNLLVVDPYGGMTARRYSPQLAPAKDGGVWVFYQRGASCMLRYVGPDGKMGDAYVAASGAVGAVCVDKKGDVHITYAAADGMRYRKIDVAGGGLGMSRVGDFDGDARADLAVFDEGSGNWYIQSATGEVLKWAHNWGGQGFVPLAGNFDTDKALKNPDELVAFDPTTANWYIQKMDGNVLANPVQWGYSGVIPLVGDCNGDGMDDLIAFDPATARWYIRTLDGQVLAWAVQWGYSGVTPMVADFDGDGRADLAVFDPATARWYIRTMAGKVLGWAIQWGYAGVVPMVANFDGDTVERADLGVFDPATAKWYLRTLGGTVIKWGARWGFSGVIPVVGDFSGNGSADLGVFDQAGGGDWYIRRVDGIVIRWNSNWGTSSMVPVGGNF